MRFFKRKTEDPEKKKSFLRRWAGDLAFAIIGVTFLRALIFEAYAIPSGSMEGSMLINDHLFVNKLAYGARIPSTPLSLPLMHNTIPLIGGRSYTDAVQLKYRRLPGFGKVERNDVVVFNGPDGDTAIADHPDLNYYQLCRVYGREAVHGMYDIVTHTYDKKDNLIKRCIALPGDVLEIKNARVYVNGAPAESYLHLKLNYLVRTNGSAPAVDEELELVAKLNNNAYVYNLEKGMVDKVRAAGNVASAEKLIRYPAGVSPSTPGEWVFPLDTANYKWNADNYGPLTIPKAGTTVQLTPQNIAMYRRIIGNYEGNTLEEHDGKFFINGKQQNTYTFKMDYYWMMGDNRHNSLDSRYWGFLPESHIVGKAWFVWLSYGDNPLDIRWDRLLRGIHTLEK